MIQFTTGPSLEGRKTLKFVSACRHRRDRRHCLGYLRRLRRGCRRHRLRCWDGCRRHRLPPVTASPASVAGMDAAVPAALRARSAESAAELFGPAHLRRGLAFPHDRRADADGLLRCALPLHVFPRRILTKRRLPLFLLLRKTARLRRGARLNGRGALVIAPSADHRRGRLPPGIPVTGIAVKRPPSAVIRIVVRIAIRIIVHDSVCIPAGPGRLSDDRRRPQLSRLALSVGPRFTCQSSGRDSSARDSSGCRAGRSACCCSPAAANGCSPAGPTCAGIRPMR